MKEVSLVGLVRSFLEQPGVTVCYLDRSMRRRKAVKTLHDEFQDKLLVLSGELTGRSYAHYVAVIAVNTHEWTQIERCEWHFIADGCDGIAPVTMEITVCN